MDPNEKFIILVGDGMADIPMKELGNRTPLETANTPNMDWIASHGITGLTRTVPVGMPPGSDTANLSIFGYNPAECYSGRAPLEALNMGIELGPDDVAFRCNIVTITEEAMASFTANHIASEYSAIIMNELTKNNPYKFIEFHPGVSYRNLIIWRGYPHAEIPSTIPPHDIQDTIIKDHVPQGNGSDVLLDIMNRARRVITGSSLIQEAGKKFKGEPTGIWLWGGGKRPSLTPLPERCGLHGNTISAVDLIHGIGRAAGLTPIRVPGVTGYIDTNYIGKAEALLAALSGSNFIFLHVESPDESGHEGNLAHKLQAIEDFDAKVVGPVLEGLKQYSVYTILVLPDHPTPVHLKTHTAEPVPFCMYSNSRWSANGLSEKKADSFNESAALSTGLFVDKAHTLIDVMIQKKLV